MHYLPGAILGSKDHRSPKRVWGYVLPFADLGLQVLYLHDVGKFGRHVLATVSKPAALPSRRKEAACSVVLAIPSHPRTGGP
jgi:hypothetical protein